MQIKFLFSNRGNNATKKIFSFVRYTTKLFWKKRALTLSALLVLIQVLSPVATIVAYAASVNSNDVGSAASLDPVGNKATRLQTQGSSGVDQSSGAFTYSYPLTIPEGRQGVSPKLVLSYNSQNTDSGWFGYNWTLSIPYIERTAKTGSDQMYTNPAFVSSIHGELLSNDGANFEQKVDDGSFAKYTFTGNSWQMTDRDGNVYYFGNNDQSRIIDASSTKIGRWYITEMRDKFGNGIIYDYAKDSGTVYPSTISYTEHALAHPLNLITFNLETKSDQIISYKYGFRTVDTKRVSYIKVATNGKDNTYFTFTYTTGSNGVRSLLQNIEEKHLSTNDDWTVLPKATFEYEKSAVTFSGTISNSSNPYGSSTVIDTNNDGTNDLYTADEGYYPIDINGDFKKDLMKSEVIYNTNSSGQYINYKFNEGGTFFTRSLVKPYNGAYLTSMVQNLPAPPLRSIPYGAPNWQREGVVADVNGDGFDDIVYNDPYGNGVGINTTNNTFNYASTSNLWFYIAIDQLVDVNGDGLQDRIAKSYTSTSTLYSVYFNTGSSYATSTVAYDAGIASSTSAYYDDGTRFVDVNNDGLVDVVRSYNSSAGGSCPAVQTKNVIALNTGNGFSLSSSTLSGYLVTYSSCSANSTKEYDTNGDLTTDYDSSTNNTAKQDILKKVTNPLGSTMDITYTWTSKTGLNSSLPVPMYIVATTTDKLSASDSDPHAVGYSFYDGQMYFASSTPRDHRFAGFGHVTTVDGNNKKVTYFHQGNGDDSTTGESGDSYYSIGRPYREDTYDLSTGTSTLISKTLSLYATYSNASSTFTYLDSQVVNTYGSDGSYLSSAAKNVYDKTKRLIKISYNYGDIESFISFASSTITDKGTDLVTTNYEYTNVRPQRLVRQVSTDYSGNTISDVTYFYDHLPTGLVDKGAITNVITSAYNSDGTLNSTSSSQTSYDSTGNAIQITDNLNHVTKINYDSSYFFPTTKIDALSGTTTYTYDPYTLNLLSSKGPDGITYVKETDGLGKVTRSYTLTAQGGVADDVRTSYVYAGGISVYSRKIGDSGSVARSLQVYDSYGRLIQSKIETLLDVFLTQDTTYDASSNIISTSLPYTTTGYGLTTVTPSNGKVVYTYDGVGRVTSKATFGTTVTYEYGPRSLTVYDNASNQHKKFYSYDAFGNINQVKEYNGASVYTTSYNYTPFGKLSRITDANSNVRNFSYLTNGLLIHQEDPHTASDTTFTTYDYAYDSLSNPISKAGPLGTTTYTYDALNRPTARNVNDTTYGTSSVSITYSGCSNNYDAPCTITRDTSSTTLSYTNSGRLNSEMLSIDGKTFTRSYTYDAYSNPLTVTYPDNGKAVYTYTLDGKQATLNYVTPGNVTKTIISNSSFNSLGALSSLSFGNGIQMCNTYTNQSTDGVVAPKLAKSVYLFNSTGCSLSGANQIELYKDEFTYKDNMTPSAVLSTYKDIAGTTHTKSDAYTYDNLARLTQVSTSYDSGTAITDTLIYDPIGNILKENDVLYRYSQDGTQNVHAATSIGGMHIAYDAQGNRIQSGDSTYSWNVLNQLVSATSTNGNEMYTYNENGERIKKIVRASTTIIQQVTPSTATSSYYTSFTSSDLFAPLTSSSTTYIATSSYNTLSSLSLLSTTTLYTMVSGYYGSPFTSKFCALESPSNRANCIVATTEQLLANDINNRSTSTVATNGLVIDMIKIATGEYLIPTSYDGLATSSIASSDPTTFSINSGTISSYNTYVSSGIVVPLSQYSNLPYVSTTTYATLQTIGLIDTSKVKAVMILAGCTSTTTACTTAKKVIFEKYYKESGYLLSDRVLQEMWYVFSAQARLPGNSLELTSTSTVLGSITVPSVTGIGTSFATSTYYSSLYFATEYSNQNTVEPRLQFFNTIPYLVTQSTFAELKQAAITQTTMENYEALIADILTVSIASSSDYVTALDAFIQYDKKATLSVTALRELYLVALGVATIPNNETEYTDYSVYDLMSYLTVQTYYGTYANTLSSTASGCNGGTYSGGFARCAIRVSQFTLPVSASATVTYLLSVTAPNPTDFILNAGESSNGRALVDYTNYGTQVPSIYSSRYAPATSLSNQDYISGSTSTDGLTQTIDVTSTIIKQKASSTDPATILLMNRSGWTNGEQYAYESRNVSLKAYVSTPRLTLASTTLMTLASQYVPSYFTATSAPNVATSNLVAYYKLENNLDSIHSYNLSNYDVIDFSSNGKIGKGADLGSSNSTKYLKVDSTLGYASSDQPLSVSCWVKPSSVPANGETYTIINKMNGSAFGGGGSLWRLVYYTSGGTTTLQASNDFGSTVTYNTTLSTSTWSQVVFTFNGTNTSTSTRLYINTSNVASGNGYGVGDFSVYPSTVSIGSSRTGIDSYWNGMIDDCGIWNTELTSNDISDIYTNASNGFYPFSNPGSLERIATTTNTISIQTAVGSYFAKNYDSSNDITISTSSPLTFISQASYNEFASTTLQDSYAITKVFLATSTPTSCTTDALITECDKLVRKASFKDLVGKYSGFVPSDAAVEEFWMVHKGILSIPYSTSSATVLYGSSTNSVIFINNASTTVNVFSRSLLPLTLATSTATTTINLTAIPEGLLTALQYNTTYSTSTFATATSTKIVSEDTYNELLNTPLRINSDVYTIFNYALPYATSSCPGEAATSSCVITAIKTKVKNTVSSSTGFVMSDAALEELYRVNNRELSILPIAINTSSTTIVTQTITLPLDAALALTTFSTSTTGTTTVTASLGTCSLGTNGATTSKCYIGIPYVNSTISSLILGYTVSTSSVSTSTISVYLSQLTQNATSTGSTSTPTFTTTVATSTITGSKLDTRFSFDITSVYKDFLNSSSPSLTVIPDANGTSSSVISLSSTTLTITRTISSPRVSYNEFISSITVSTTTSDVITPISTTTLLTYYKMENVNDSVHSYTLTNVGSLSFNSAKIDNGADLGSSNSTKYLHVDNTLGYTSNAQALSMTCWVKVSTAPSSGSVYTLMNKMNGSGFGGNGGLWRWYYYNNSGTTQLRASNDFGAGTASYNVTLTTDTWYHVGMTFSGSNNGSSLKLYVNGTSTASANGYGNGDFSPYTNTLSIGSNRNGSADYWSGKIDECGVWNSELSGAEMTQLYNSNNGLQYPFSGGTTTIYTTATGYGYNSAQPVPFDRSTIPSYSTSTATTTIDLTNVPSLDFSSAYSSPVEKIISTGITGSTTVLVSTSSEVAYYKLDNVNDSANSYNLTNVNSTSFNGGKMGNGADFGASNSTKYLYVNSALGYTSNSQPLSVSCWVNVSTAPSSGSVYTIMNKMNGAGFGGNGGLWRWYYYNNGGTTQLKASNDYGAGVASYNTTFTPDTWYYLTFTYDGNNASDSLKLYINGSNVASANGYGNGDFSAYTTTLSLGSNRNGSADYFSGLFDECSVWNTKLSSTDITTLYNSGSGLQHPFQVTIGGTATTTIYTGSYLDTVYSALPTPPQQVLPQTIYPYATSSVATSTINTLTVSTTTQYTVYTPFSSYVEDSRGTVTTYLTLNGKLVGTYTYQSGQEASTGKVTYMLTNYLDTPVLQTDDHGDIVEAGMTDVFGNYVYRDTRKDSAVHNKAFTSHEYDEVTQLTYAHARYLDTKAHTFLSVDPMIYKIPETYLLDPQQMNSYAYARNNPVVMSDPTGESIISIFNSIVNSISNAVSSVSSTISSIVSSVSTQVTTVIAKSQQVISNVASSAQTQIVQPAAKAIDTFVFSGFASSAASNYSAGNYAQGTAMLTLAVASGVATVYTAPEKTALVATTKTLSWLAKGEKTSVYIGYGADGIAKYVGITKDIIQRQKQWGDKYRLEPIAIDVTRNQARSIEQAIIKAQESFDNQINSIRESREIYQGALEWGTDYLKRNNLSQWLK